jgi:hypothetical protein
MKKLGALATLGFWVGTGAGAGAGSGMLLGVGLALLGAIFGLGNLATGDVWLVLLGGGAGVGALFGLGIAGVVLPLRALLARRGHPPILANLAGLALFLIVPRVLWAKYVGDAPVNEVEAAQVRRSGAAQPGIYVTDHGQIETEAVTVGDVRFSQWGGARALQPGATVMLSTLEGDSHPDSCPGQVVRRDDSSLLVKRARPNCSATWNLRAEGTIGAGALLVPARAATTGNERMGEVWVATPCKLCRLRLGSDKPTHKLTRREVVMGWTTSGPQPELEIRSGLAEGEWVALGFSPSNDGEEVRISSAPPGH